MSVWCSCFAASIEGACCFCPGRVSGSILDLRTALQIAEKRGLMDIALLLRNHEDSFRQQNADLSGATISPLPQNRCYVKTRPVHSGLRKLKFRFAALSSPKSLVASLRK